MKNFKQIFNLPFWTCNNTCNSPAIRLLTRNLHFSVFPYWLLVVQLAEVLPGYPSSGLIRSQELAFAVAGHFYLLSPPNPGVEWRGWHIPSKAPPHRTKRRWRSMAATVAAAAISPQSDKWKITSNFGHDHLHVVQSFIIGYNLCIM